MNSPRPVSLIRTEANMHSPSKYFSLRFQPLVRIQLCTTGSQALKYLIAGDKYRNSWNLNKECRSSCALNNALLFTCIKNNRRQL